VSEGFEEFCNKSFALTDKRKKEDTIMKTRTNRIIGLILGCLIAIALSTGGFRITAERPGDQDTKQAISADQMIAAIKTATTAKPGNVREVEVTKEGDKTICEVEILAQDGKAYDVKVDVATNSVIKVEEDKDND
jgi:uncharacterized membrane protein YkoI